MNLRATIPAPTSLPNYRSFRYRGDSQSVAMDLLAPADQTRLRRMYEFLVTVRDRLGALGGGNISPSEKLLTALDGLDLATAYENMLQLGSDTQSSDEMVLRALHDARGGSYGGILAFINPQLTSEARAELRPLYYYAHDECKILRNTFLGLDVEGHEQDLKFKPHYLGAAVDKLKATFPLHAGKQRMLHVSGDYEGAITSCCCESSAVDRVLHNLLENAARRSASKQVELDFYPIPASYPRDLRFLVANPVSAHALAELSAEADRNGDLAALFRRPPAFEATHGLGLRIVAAFVAEAYGLEHEAEAVEEGYVGARLMQEHFIAWFLWPLLEEGVPAGALR